MPRDMRDFNKKLTQMAGNIQPSQGELDQFGELYKKYKNKSQREIEEEMNHLMGQFSRTEKDNLVRKLYKLKEMEGLLDDAQKRKVDMFIQLLSQ
ncbi:hypothetical protein QBE52_06710 [Clostridiaceae bacterium 35-E11]